MPSIPKKEGKNLKIETQLKELKKENAYLKEKLNTIKLHLGRRKSPRIDIQIEINYKVGKKVFSGITKNISEGGLFLETDQTIDTDTDLLLTFGLISEDQIEVRGLVVYNFSNGIGIKFLGPKRSLHKIRLMLKTISNLNAMITK
ncbi:MAG: PilZ domain-containing protein [bacterium]